MTGNKYATLVSIYKAMASFHPLLGLLQHTMSRGDVDGCFSNNECDHVIEGTYKVGLCRGRL